MAGMGAKWPETDRLFSGGRRGKADVADPLAHRCSRAFAIISSEASEPLGGGSKVAKMVDGNAFRTEAEMLEGFGLAGLHPRDGAYPRRHMRIVVWSGMLRNEILDIFKESRIEFG